MTPGTVGTGMGMGSLMLDIAPGWDKWVGAEDEDEEVGVVPMGRDVQCVVFEPSLSS